MEDAGWKKATQSSGQTNCVEIRRDLRAVRDSKHREVALTVNVSAFVKAIRNN
jgi:hypothetical protein